MTVEGAAGSEAFKFVSTSDPEKRQKTLMPSGVEGLLSGSPEEGVDARGIQPFYTGILARMTDMELEHRHRERRLHVHRNAQGGRRRR